AWGTAFWEQLAIALVLHQKIDTVLVVDHLQCGAFRHFLPGYDDNMEAYHRDVTAYFALQVKARHPNLKVERWLLEPTPGSQLTWQARCLTTDRQAERIVPCHEHT